ncbi:hypothetical protein AWB64_04949 [Caballeronia sordidicola]|uniref:Uncharacterized protein n=1 Tax=Caballeronia sordidicola TaxID=196367 RepID=A0A158HRL1_CABSO|nr:hypothetical protein [Caballeronia sordidicola]SAL47015.1 hypothetical protein AWB64_04949 [Caballeronia sordidicola]
MHTDKSNDAPEREILMALATRYRTERATAASSTEANWECGRGHAWDDALSAAQNVRCMNCASQRREQRTERLRALAAERGGKLVSAGYVDASTPLAWECAFGHMWEAQPDDVARCWCNECARIGVYGRAMCC